MGTVLVTDVVGLVGKCLIQEIVSLQSSLHPPTGLSSLRIRAGYHTQAEVEAAVNSNPYPELIQPVLVDWKKKVIPLELLVGANQVFLLLPFTSTKVETCQRWIDAASTAGVSHVVHVGVHCNASDVANHDRLPHETWQLEAEDLIRNSGMPWTFLRINFDGYHGVLKPGEIAYFLPADMKFGWIAREDIAAVGARVLLEPDTHSGQVYALSTEALSLEDMARVATEVSGTPIAPRTMTPEAFLEFATSPLANPDGDRDYVTYMESVAKLFEGLARGRYQAHTQVFPQIVWQVCLREPLAFREWLSKSPLRAKLMQKRQEHEN